MRFMLVLQWPTDSIADFDQLIAIEDRLIDALSDEASVDGHDVGSGEMNLFIHTDQPQDTFRAVQTCLQEDPAWTAMRAAYREADGEVWTVLWPPGQRSFDIS